MLLKIVVLRISTEFSEKTLLKNTENNTEPFYRKTLALKSISLQEKGFLNEISLWILRNIAEELNCRAPANNHFIGMSGSKNYCGH